MPASKPETTTLKTKPRLRHPWLAELVSADTDYVRRRVLSGSVPRRFHQELKELLRKVEKEGPILLSEALREGSIVRIHSSLGTESLLAHVDLGAILHPAGNLFIAFLSVDTKKEKHLVKMVIERWVPEEYLREGERWANWVIDVGFTQRELIGRFPGVTIGQAIVPQGGYEDHLLRRILYRELQKVPPTPHADILNILDGLPEGAAEGLQQSSIFRKWKAEHGIGCWGDIKDDKELLAKWRSFVSKFKRSQIGP